ncbi:MAG TPA: cupin domain-containing protein [Terriglobia bacterium]|nr:cupin domain-containing protein [Terriglobia bacterium]
MDLPRRITSVLGVLALATLVVLIHARRTTGLPLPAGNTPPGGASPSSGVIYFPTDKVQSAFAKGAPLIAGPEGGRNYAILCGRRDRPGEVETHALDTDVFYVVEGSATFVTGGTAIDSKASAPNEMRGARIEGGETRTLSKGDVLVIPKGIPHWFKSVEPGFLYFVVKVR